MNWKVRLAKRTIDIVSATIGLAITAPLFPLIAAAIKVDSRGSVFYRQRRAGSPVRAERAAGPTPLRLLGVRPPEIWPTPARAGRGAGGGPGAPAHPPVARPRPR